MEISSHFLNELYRLLFLKKDILEICKVHLEYHYIPKELPSYKKILKDCITYYTNNEKIPSFGIIAQQNLADKKIQETLEDIKNTKVQDKAEIIRQLESYIKQVKFIELYDKVTKLYNDDKQEEAIRTQAIESEKIVNFSLGKGTGKFRKIFKDFKDRQDKRTLESMNQTHSIKIPFGVDELDEISHGGSEEGQADIMIARSGTAKTTWLIHRAIAASRRGFKVLFISAEDTEERIVAKIDSAWTAQKFRDIRVGNVTQEILDKLEKVQNDLIKKGSEIDVYAFEKFGTANMVEVRDIIIEYQKINGCVPDLICLDHLDKFHPSDGRRYSASTDGEKLRKQSVADSMVNLAIEFKTRVATAIQTGDINPNEWNRPEFKITRSNTSGDRNIANSFAYVFTHNVTNDEYKNKVARIYVDKNRDEIGEQVIKIATAYNKGKYYDRVRTLQLYGVE